MAFELEGFCVVRGPDILLGGDIKGWNCISGKFDGVIGGPPCKTFSTAVTGQDATEGNLIPEFERILDQTQPKWFVMENVRGSPPPKQATWNGIYDAWEFGALQHRTRRFSSNLDLSQQLEKLKLSPDQRHPDPFPCVLATEHKYEKSKRDKRRAGRKIGRRLTLQEINVLMGLPEEFETPALLLATAYAVRGNGVPIQMGRTIARSVKMCLEEKCSD